MSGSPQKNDILQGDLRRIWNHCLHSPPICHVWKSCCGRTSMFLANFRNRAQPKSWFKWTFAWSLSMPLFPCEPGAIQWRNPIKMRLNDKWRNLSGARLSKSMLVRISQSFVHPHFWLKRRRTKPYNQPATREGWRLQKIEWEDNPTRRFDTKHGAGHWIDDPFQNQIKNGYEKWILAGWSHATSTGVDSILHAERSSV